NVAFFAIAVLIAKKLLKIGFNSKFKLILENFLKRVIRRNGTKALYKFVKSLFFYIPHQKLILFPEHYH
ncbi:hypothetical protein, partial [Pedobacter antarcticus]|uniref:hypothetical protein n=1 Tax=Pedobacter antarcticus TaxID=34086 RepID=UPI00055B3549